MYIYAQVNHYNKKICRETTYPDEIKNAHKNLPIFQHALTQTMNNVKRIFADYFTDNNTFGLRNSNNEHIYNNNEKKREEKTNLHIEIFQPN